MGRLSSSDVHSHDKHIVYSTTMNSKLETKIQLTSSQFYNMLPFHRGELMFKEVSVEKVKSCAEKILKSTSIFFLHHREMVNSFHPLGQPSSGISLNLHASQQYF